MVHASIGSYDIVGLKALKPMKLNVLKPLKSNEIDALPDSNMHLLAAKPGFE